MILEGEKAGVLSHDEKLKGAQTSVNKYFWVLVMMLRTSLLSQRSHLIHISSNRLLYYKYLLLAPVPTRKKCFKFSAITSCCSLFLCRERFAVAKYQDPTFINTRIGGMAFGDFFFFCKGLFRLLLSGATRKPNQLLKSWRNLLIDFQHPGPGGFQGLWF